jgi:hypothetical protein
MHLLGLALAFPAVVFTVLLGVVLVYWLLVIAGAAQLDALGEGAADGAIDGALEGHGDGLADAPGHAGPAGAEHQVEGTLSGLLAALRLRAAPATVVLSSIIVFSWVLSMAGMLAVEALVPRELAVPVRASLLVLAPLLALLPTSLAMRPLAPLFTVARAAAHADFVGKVCTVRTGTVTERFGEAQVEDGGAGVVVRVRVATGESLSRGEQAVIVGYDEQRQEFTVAPLSAADEVLGGSRLPREEPGDTRQRRAK